MQQQKDNWDDGTIFTPNEIKSATLWNYNNLVNMSTVPPMKSASVLTTNAKEPPELSNNNNSRRINRGATSGGALPKHSTSLAE